MWSGIRGDRMERELSADQLAEHWTLEAANWQWLANKTGATRLGFAALLKFFESEGRFPRNREELPPSAIHFLAQQVHVPADAWGEYRWEGRTFEYHRAQIRTALGFREGTAEDIEALRQWMLEHLLAHERNLDRLKDSLAARCREVRIEPFTPDRVDRLVRSAIAGFEDEFSRGLTDGLPLHVQQGLDALLADSSDSGRVPLHELRADPGPISIETLEGELDKLRRLRGLALPVWLFGRLAPEIVQGYRRRAAVEEIHELRRHPLPIRLTLLAAFCHLRTGELIDTLSDLLIDMVHRVAHRAETRVERELIADFKRVSGKNTLLFEIAEAALAQPEEPVRAVVYPIANEQTLRDLVREFKATGPAYRQQLHAVMKSAYRSHYRAMLIRLLDTLEFHSNNETHRPVLDGLAVVKQYADSRMHTYPLDVQIPIAGIVRGPWQETVMEQDERGTPRINRHAYEMCVLLAVRERLRSKELWVFGANRYRNPDEDLPTDFVRERAAYYAALKLPRDATLFVSQLEQELGNALTRLNDEMARNEYVRILNKDGGWISLSPLPVQIEPENVASLKIRMLERWPLTSLLDVFKEADLRIRFTDVFRSATAWENLDREVIQERLLLTLYGLGSNAGIKRMSAGQPRTKYKDLLYVRRRYITKDQLRAAIRDGGKCHLPRAKCQHMGRRNDGLRVGFQEVRCLGPKSHDRMARPLWRPRRHDLLARRA
jgi:hypothetical protein